jgi:predicted Zn-dependent protease
LLSAAALLVSLLIAPPWGVVRATREILRALDAGHASEALAILGQMRVRLARKSYVCELRALALAVAGDRPAAVTELEDLLARAPARRSAALNLAHLVLARGPARALALLEELERRVPGTFAVTMGRASALRRLGRAPEAWRAVEEALQRDPDKGAAQSLAARIAVGEGRIEEAEQRLQLAEQLDPGSPSHQICRAELEIAQGAMDRARSSLREARQVAARQPFAFAMLDDLEDLSARLGEAPAPA